MLKKINSALISVYFKDGLDELVKTLHSQGVTIYSTGGTQQYIQALDVPVIPVEELTKYPSILGGRVKTLHPLVFGGILGKRADAGHQADMQSYAIPELDLVIVDLYPFEETVANTTDEASIIEKIDIGGPSMLRAAAKNHMDVTVIARKQDYEELNVLLLQQEGSTTLEQRRAFAITAFDVCTAYDLAISNYFHQEHFAGIYNTTEQVLRYGENPHQSASYYGQLTNHFRQLHGKELSYNNLVDVDAALQLMYDLPATSFAIIKHTNACGVATRPTVEEAWEAALAGDPQSAFGGILITNAPVNLAVAQSIQEIFFEVLLAPSFTPEAFEVLSVKKNRILLETLPSRPDAKTVKSLLGGMLVQSADEGNAQQWDEVGGRPTTTQERTDLELANTIAKHLKSNAIALVKNSQLIGKGCGQTSRIDALQQAIQKAAEFGFDTTGAVLASDAFFPFSDCVETAFAKGIQAFIQPGGSIRDKDSIAFCKANNLAMVITGQRHFRH